MSARILHIDDDLDQQTLIRAILQSHGYTLHQLTSAEGLEAAIIEFQPALVLCDLILPGRDGLSVCRDLRANSKTRDLPVVVISAKSFEMDISSALAAGAVGYLVKPFDLDHLLAVVRDALASMKVRVWGCRGSICAPEKHGGLYGGNTACVSLSLGGSRHLVFDAGTGIRLLGQSLAQHSALQIALCFSHFHWDHIFGLPFFVPLYVPGNEVTIYGPAESNDALRELIEIQMSSHYFPVSTEAFQARVRFVGLQEQTFEALNVSISTFQAMHPCRTLAYRAHVRGSSLVYAPDNELVPETTHPQLTGEALRLANFCAGASLLLHDCTYSRASYERHRGWGHSGPAAIAAVAAQAQLQRVLLFHHDPDSSDEQVQAIAGEYAAACEALGSNVPGEPAREGGVYELE